MSSQKHPPEMSTSTNTSQPTSWIVIVCVIGMGIWTLKGCVDSRKERDLGLKGIGMLEAHGVSTEVLPNFAAKDFYLMMEQYKDGVGGYTKEDIDRFLLRIKMYQTGHGLLRDRGVSSDTIRNEIGGHMIIEALEQSDQQKAFDDLARKYK